MKTTPREVLGDRFFDLLEASAEEAGQSVRLLTALVKTGSESADSLAAVRRKSEQITNEINATLAKTIMASLHLDDIQGLSRALRIIPDRVGTFAVRFILARQRLAGADFSPLVDLLETAMENTVVMVHQLRAFSNLESTLQLHARLQDLLDGAETLLDRTVEDLFRRPDDALRVVIVKDLCDQAQSIIDACRDTGSLVYQGVLKYV